MDAHTIGAAGPADAGEMLTLQRAAYVTEAQLYDDPKLPALTQTLASLVEELTGSVALKAVTGQRMVGAVRMAVEGGTGKIGRLVVAPDRQGTGIGTALMAAVEATAGPEVERFELFTGHRSTANLALYERLGYRRFDERPLSPTVTLVYLDKQRR